MGLQFGAYCFFPPSTPSLLSFVQAWPQHRHSNMDKNECRTNDSIVPAKTDYLPVPLHPFNQAAAAAAVL